MTIIAIVLYLLGMFMTWTAASFELSKRERIAPCIIWPIIAMLAIYMEIVAKILNKNK